MTHSPLEEVLKKLVEEIRLADGRDQKTSFLIIDSQSVKNTDTAKYKGYDAGKKVSGIKRHIAVDINGLPHAISVTTADVSDRNGALEALHRHKASLSNVSNTLADGGYTGKQFALGVHAILGSRVQIAKRIAINTFAVIHNRWIVERSFSWLEKCRRLWKNCERYLNTSLHMTCSPFLSCF